MYFLPIPIDNYGPTINIQRREQSAVKMTASQEE